MTALFRHKLTGRGKAATVKVTVYGNDGRHPDTFSVSHQELQRFAWAVLADLSPEEARTLAAEENVDLDAARKVGPVRSFTQVHRATRSSDPYIAGSPRHLLLRAANVAGGRPTPQLEAALPARDIGWRAMIAEMVEEGSLVRSNPGKGGTRAWYRLSDYGHERLEQLDRLAA